MNTGNKKEKIKLKAIKPTLKTGAEKLTVENVETKYSLLNFWQWSVSDILSNATRGRFAEFIVGTAIDMDLQNLRDEWDAYDLSTEDGVKIEIKSASYIQSWQQSDYSRINFSIKPTKHWDAKNGMSRGEAKRHADVYVFCLLKHKDQKTINPLQMEQWDFYVVPTHKLDNYARSKSSITLNSLKKLVQANSYLELKEKIYEKYTEQLKHKSKNLF